MKSPQGIVVYGRGLELRAVQKRAAPAILSAAPGLGKSREGGPKFESKFEQVSNKYTENFEYKGLGYKRLSLMRDDFSGPFVRNVRNFRQL